MGRLFELHPALGVEGRAAVLDLDLAKTESLGQRERRYQALRRFPVSAFDLSVVAGMREAGIVPLVLGRSNFRDMYWTMAQMLTHHASNGCNLRSGDLLASGTVSGADKSSRGCLLELTSRGKDPVTLPTGEQRKFLEDGDEVILRGFCEREGFRRIGLGICQGTVLPATMR